MVSAAEASPWASSDGGGGGVGRVGGVAVSVQRGEKILSLKVSVNSLTHFL